MKVFNVCLIMLFFHRPQSCVQSYLSIVKKKGILKRFDCRHLLLFLLHLSNNFFRWYTNASSHSSVSSVFLVVFSLPWDVILFLPISVIALSSHIIFSALLTACPQQTSFLFSVLFTARYIYYMHIFYISHYQISSVISKILQVISSKKRGERDFFNSLNL